MFGHIYNNPEKYSKNNALQYNFAMKLLSKISFNNESRILDIGCGDGLITYEIASIVTNGCTIGTDISTKMIEFASKKYIEQKNLGFLVMNAKNNIFREQFDVITSFNCLHWVKDQQSALNGIARSAINGAQIVLLLSHKKSLYHHVIDTVCSSYKWKDFFLNFKNPRSFFDKNEYKEMLNEASLSVTDLVEEEMIYTFKSKEEVKNFFSAAGSQIKEIPEARKEEFLQDFLEEYLKNVKCSPDIIPVGFWCLQVIAVKQKSELHYLNDAYNVPKL